MRKYLPHVLIISFVFILAPTAQVASFDAKKGLEDAKEEVRKNPDDPEAHYNLGLAYGANGMGKKAIKSYKQAIRIDPDYAVAHCGLGIAYYGEGDRRSALKEYEILKELDTRLANALFDFIYSE